jgi:hypothetical protein
MQIQVSSRRQICIVWVRIENEFDKFGQPAFETPVFTRCRWQEVNQKYLNLQGDEVVCSHKITPELVFPAGSFCKLTNLRPREVFQKVKNETTGQIEDVVIFDIGDLVDLTKNPKEVEGAVEIKRYDSQPELRPRFKDKFNYHVAFS